MKHCSLLLAGMMIAGIAGGCAADHQDSDRAGSKYGLLNGSTKGVADAEKGGADGGAEPALSVETRFAAGQLAESRGQLDCAVQQYNQALLLDGGHVPSLYRLGIVYVKSKEYAKSIDIWERYVKATNGLASAYSNLGFACEMSGDLARAERAYKDGLARDPKSEPCRVNYGLMLARNNRVPEATQQLAAVLPPAEVSYNLAVIDEQQGAIAQAREGYKKALEQNPRMSAAQSKLAALDLREP